MHTDFPPEVDYDTDALDEQRNADNRHQEVGHVGDIEDVHEAKVAADIDDIGNSTFVTFAKFE